MKHTAGPWQTSGEESGAYPAQILVHAEPDAKGEQVVGSAWSIEYHRYDEWVANARLIAAAPDLLRVLERAYGYVHQAPLEGALVMAAEMRAAIAKARGES